MTAEQFKAGVDAQQNILLRKGRLNYLAQHVIALKKGIAEWREDARKANETANDLAAELRKTELEMLEISERMEP